MTESPTKTCPSCHQGEIVRTEKRPDGCTKFFSCGHTHHEVVLEAKLETHGNIRFKARRQGVGKPYLEGKTGGELHRETGIWMFVERIIDRANNWYKERITDPKTGKIVHSCEEPLDQHRGHGSAKKNKP